MEKHTFHHGNLRDSMIKSGISIINEEGVKSISLRKIGQLCGVSHTAVYKHFNNKDMLIYAIKDHIADEFAKCLSSTNLTTIESDEEKILAFGKIYIQYFVENPSHYTFLFTQPNFRLTITENNISCENFPPFSIFISTVEKIMEERGMPKEDLVVNVVALLSIVDGLVSVFTSNSIDFKGDYMYFIDRVLREKIVF